MSPSEAPLDFNIVPYGFTINVSPKKILYNRKTWSDYSNEEQKNKIHAVITMALHEIQRSHEDVEFTYELTKLGCIHAHGLIMCKESDIRLFQSVVHKQLGFPKVDPSVCCKYTKTLVSDKFWKRYMAKYQDVDYDGYKPVEQFMF